MFFLFCWFLTKRYCLKLRLIFVNEILFVKFDLFFEWYSILCGLLKETIYVCFWILNFIFLIIWWWNMCNWIEITLFEIENFQTLSNEMKWNLFFIIISPELLLHKSKERKFQIVVCFFWPTTKVKTVFEQSPFSIERAACKRTKQLERWELQLHQQTDLTMTTTVVESLSSRPYYFAFSREKAGVVILFFVFCFLLQIKNL